MYHDGDDGMQRILDHSAIARMKEQQRPVWRQRRRRSPLSAPSKHCRYIRELLLAVLWTTATTRDSVLVVVSASSSNGDFEPYVLNGGLVSAVAGKDYFVLACDTRLSGHSGYDICERHHVSSRLWSPLTTCTTAIRSSSSQPRSRFIAPDGSLALDLLSSTREAKKDNEELLTLHETAVISDDAQEGGGYSPVWIGSVGCLVDCEHLKRDLRADLRAAQHFGDVPATFSSQQPHLTDHVAVALSQTLYSRRSFPYYAFCLCVGIGRVFVYDAVGSYEDVAVACTGTGKSLLQPILDRKFRSATTKRLVEVDGRSSGGIPATIVDCASPEKAVQLLLDGYRSVAEREIMVGDRVVFYTVQKKSDAGGGTCECKIWSADLRKH